MGTQHEKRHRAAGMGMETSSAPLSARRGPAANSRPLPAPTQASMGAAFGHDFSQVRIFADEDAAVQADGLGAKAITQGTDIFFNQGFYDPHSGDGRTLLAHELTHVVQQDRNGGAMGGLSTVSDPGDASEREAAALAGRAAAGQTVEVRAAPTAVASRGLLDWVEDKASGAASAVGSAAGAAWDGTKAAAGAVGGAVADVAKTEYAGMKTMGGWVKQGEEAVGHGIDWVEDKEKAGTSWVADKAKGIPVLEQVANAGKSYLDTETELAGGIGRGVTGLVGGVAGMVANPVDTAKGLEAMAEHIPGIGGTGLKAAHGLLNVAMGDETMGQLGQSLSPEQSLKDDGQFWKTVGGGLVGQYSDQWKGGKYADVVGHAGFDIGSLFLGAGEANAAGKLGEAAKLADAAKLGEVADASKLADAAKIGDAADASKVADAADAGKVADAGKAEELAKTDEAAKLEGAGGGGKAVEPPTGGGGGGPGSEPMGEGHNAANYAKLKASYAAAEKGGGAIESLQKTGKLPEEYITKAEAEAAGWESGKALKNHAPGKQLGGDVFQNRPPGPGIDPIVPDAPGRTWHEADIGVDPAMKRSKSPGTRLLYSDDGKIYVTPDHYGSAHPIGEFDPTLGQ